MSSSRDDAGGNAPGRRAVIAIFGGIVIVLVTAAWLASSLRADTRARLRPPARSPASAPSAAPGAP